MLFVYFVSPYFDHDEFMHHTMHVLDVCALPLSLIFTPTEYSQRAHYRWIDYRGRRLSLTLENEWSALAKIWTLDLYTGSPLNQYSIEHPNPLGKPGRNTIDKKRNRLKKLQEKTNGGTLSAEIINN